MFQMEIFTAGYPRSGNTWLGRILSDALCAPMQEDPEVEKQRKYAARIVPNRFVIRKTHWRPHQYAGIGYNKRPSKMVFIQRDPRDVAVSVMFYRNQDDTLMQVLEGMYDPNENTEEHIYEYGGYESMVRSWLESGTADVITSYELLQYEFEFEVDRMMARLGAPVMPAEVIDLKRRQSFSKLSPTHPHSMRRGIVGDWQNHFKRGHGEKITSFLGQLMVDTGYIDDLDWWKDLEE